MKTLCVLPARWGSQRLPGKPLRNVAGRSLLEWSWRAASAADVFDAVWVATDAPEIAEAAVRFGAEVVMTAAEHATGTDRVAEVAERPEAAPYGLIVNFQADEPFADRETVRRAVRTAAVARADVVTLAAPIRTEAEWRSEHVVKVVAGRDGRVLYFSRSPVPHLRGGWAGSGGAFLRHVGIYVMARPALRRWAEAPRSALEELEQLEQLRALEVGLRFRVEVGPPTEPGVDVPEDLERAERILTAGDPRRGSERHV